MIQPNQYHLRLLLLALLGTFLFGRVNSQYPASLEGFWYSSSKGTYLGVRERSYHYLHFHNGDTLSDYHYMEGNRSYHITSSAVENAGESKLKLTFAWQGSCSFEGLMEEGLTRKPIRLPDQIEYLHILRLTKRKLVVQLHVVGVGRYGVGRYRKKTPTFKLPKFE